MYLVMARVLGDSFVVF